MSLRAICDRRVPVGTHSLRLLLCLALLRRCLVLFLRGLGLCLRGLGLLLRGLALLLRALAPLLRCLVLSLRGLALLERDGTGEWLQLYFWVLGAGLEGRFELLLALLCDHLALLGSRLAFVARILRGGQLNFGIEHLRKPVEHHSFLQKFLNSAENNFLLQNLVDGGTLLIIQGEEQVNQFLQVGAVRLRNGCPNSLRNLDNELMQARCVEWVLKRTELVEKHAQAPYICLFVVGLLVNYLRRQVVGCAYL